MPPRFATFGLTSLLKQLALRVIASPRQAVKACHQQVD